MCFSCNFFHLGSTGKRQIPQGLWFVILLSKITNFEKGNLKKNPGVKWVNTDKIVKDTQNSETVGKGKDSLMNL